MKRSKLVQILGKINRKQVNCLTTQPVLSSFLRENLTFVPVFSIKFNLLALQPVTDFETIYKVM